MEILRRTLSALLALVMVFSMLPLPALAEESETVGTVVPDGPEPIETEAAETLPEIFLEETAELVAMDAPASGTCGENLTWELADGVLTISGEGKMPDFSRGMTPWHTLRGWITSVEMKGAITSVGSYAFFSCQYLTSVTIAGGVTSIGVSAFEDCIKLTDITIPDGVTSISSGAFFGCWSLTSVTIPASVTHISGYAFSSCKKITDVYYGGSEQQWADIVISSGNQYLIDADIHCGAAMPGGGNTDNSGSCGENLTWELTDGVLTISGTGEMDSFTSDDPPWAALGETITEAYIGDGATTIGNWAFSCCPNLTNVTIPGSVTTIESGAFAGCAKLASVTIPYGVVTIANDAFNYCDSLTNITLPDSVTTVGSYAFANCDNLKSVVFPDSVTSIGVYAFSYCVSLTKVTLSKSITCINPWTFWCCVNLKNISIPDGVTSISNWAFWCCNGLESITIPDSVTSIGLNAFEDCFSLTDVYYGGNKEQWDDIAIDDVNECLTDANIHFNSIGPDTDPDDPGPTPSAGPVKEYVDNSNIKINGSGAAWAHYIGEPNQTYTVRVNDEEMPVSANERGVIEVFLGIFDSVGEKNVTVEITHVGGKELPAPQVFQSTVSVMPLEFSQNWKVSLDADVAMELTAGKKCTLLDLELSLGKVKGKIGAGASMNVARSYSAAGETLEFSSDKRIEKGATVKCGVTGSTLGNLFESGVHGGLSGGGTARYGLKIENYSAQDSIQQKAIATYLLGEVLSVKPMFLSYVPFHRYLAEKYYDQNNFQVINGGAFKVGGTFGAAVGEVKINGVDVVTVVEGEVEGALELGVNNVSDGDREVYMNTTLENKMSALSFDGKELLLDATFLGFNSLSHDMKVAAKVSDGENLLEFTTLDDVSTEMKVMEIGTPTKAVYNKYTFRDEALDCLISNTSHFGDYINRDLYVLSFLDLCQLANVLSTADAPVEYEEETKELFAASLPLKFGISALVGGELGITLSYLEDTSYTGITGYVVDDRTVQQTNSGDLSSRVEDQKQGFIEIFTNCIQSLAEDAANFFKKVGGKIQEGVDAGWSWVKEKGESAREWLIEITSAPSKNDGAWGESMEIGILGSYVNFSLARQAATPNDAYVTRTGMTVGRPFVVNVTDNATGEAITNFEEEPLEFTICYAGEDLMAANYNAETQVISMYRYSDEGDYFEYIGGIHDADAMTVTAIITKPGQYILAAEAIEEEGCGFELGDVNHDGKINAKDATLILQKSVGVLKETTKFCEDCAEVSGDGKLNAKDSTLILQFSVGLRDSFPAQK